MASSERQCDVVCADDPSESFWLPPDILFCRLPPGPTMFIVDARPKAEQSRLRIRGNFRPVPELLEPDGCKDLADVLSRLVGYEHIVVILPSSLSTGVQGLDAQLAIVKTLGQDRQDEAKVEILHGGFEAFYARYELCQPLFDGDDIVKKQLPMLYPSEILPELYLGNAKTAMDKRVYEHLGITRVVDATGKQVSKAAAEAAGASYLSINADDMPHVDLSCHFSSVEEELRRCLTSLRPEGKREVLLVHCQAGVSRSVTLVLAALMKVGPILAERARWVPGAKCWTLKQAVEHVLVRRPWAMPNEGFRKQLISSETAWLGESSVGSDDVGLRRVMQAASGLSVNHPFDERAAKKNGAST